MDELQSTCEMKNPLVDNISTARPDSTFRCTVVHIRPFLMHLVAVRFEEIPERWPTGIGNSGQPCPWIGCCESVYSLAMLSLSLLPSQNLPY